MDIILIPGLWLDGGSWAEVVPVLEQAGHHTQPLTLPGMDAKYADRSVITLADHVAAVVAAIDAVPANVVLVGHSAGAAIAHAAIDARPDRVERAVYVGGFPTGAGDAIADGFPAKDGEVPLPEWSAFEEEELVDLDEAALAAFRADAIPSPERVTRDPQRLTDERRYDVPVTVIATEFTSDMLRGWIAQGLAPVRELEKIREVTHVDLPTGHWPQFTRPVQLGRAIVASIGTLLDEQGRPDTPITADEVTTVLAFLDHERGSVAWKTAGLDAAGLAATTADSAMTLGGLLKHLAYVEDVWFSRRLHGRPAAPPWDTVDWEADRDWDWHSAVDDPPERLLAMWQDAVTRSRALVAEALADGGLDHRAAWVDDWYGEPPTLRWILLHMIREYARHVGHADLLRESVDGETGE
jgi:pimeloyl-ACP methyl ester carboxylesterase